MIIRWRQVLRRWLPGIISGGADNDPSGIVTAADAARALEPLAGPLAQELFAVGIIGAGLLAVPVLAVSTAYVVAEFFGWRDSVSDKPAQAKPF